MLPHIDFSHSAAGAATPAPANTAGQRGSALQSCAGRLRGVDPVKADLTGIEPVAKTHLMRHVSDWVTDPRLC